MLKHRQLTINDLSAALRLTADYRHCFQIFDAQCNHLIIANRKTFDEMSLRRRAKSLASEW